jgi:hypothetical protein
MLLLVVQKRTLSGATVIGVLVFATLASALSAAIAAAVTMPLLSDARVLGVFSGSAIAALGTAVGLMAYVALTIAARRPEALPLLRRVAQVAPKGLRPIILRAETPE